MSYAAITLLTEKELKDTTRSRWFLLISVVFAVLTFALSMLGMSGLGNLGITGFGRTTASLLNLVLLLVPLMGLLLGAINLTSEKEQGTLRTLMAQPLVPSEIYLGKFLGNMAALVMTLSLGFGVSGIVIALRGGMMDLQAYLMLAGFTVLLGLIFLAMGLCISVLTSRVMNAVALALFIWFLFLFMSDLGLMGSAVVLKLSAPQLLGFALLNPCQIFKITLIQAMHKDLEILGPVGTYALELWGNHFFIIMTLFLLVWLAVPTLLSLFLFKRQCIR